MSKEYIDRSATVDALNKLCDRVCQYSKAQRKVMCGACPLGDAFTVIEDDLPAADVVEVRHSHWVYDGYGEFHCHACKTIWHITEGTIDDLAFCPNCGAKMDGGADDAAD